MPFDSAPSPSTPGKAVQILAEMEENFMSGEWTWTQGFVGLCGPRFCLHGGARQLHPIDARSAMAYLARAIKGYRRSWRIHTYCQIVYDYNDAPDRTLAEIVAIIRKAKAIAEADARPILHGLDKS